MVAASDLRLSAQRAFLGRVRAMRRRNQSGELLLVAVRNGVWDVELFDEVRRELSEIRAGSIEKLDKDARNELIMFLRIVFGAVKTWEGLKGTPEAEALRKLTSEVFHVIDL